MAEQTLRSSCAGDEEAAAADLIPLVRSLARRRLASLSRAGIPADADAIESDLQWELLKLLRSFDGRGLVRGYAAAHLVRRAARVGPGLSRLHAGGCS